MLVRPVRPARRADRGTSGKLQRIANKPELTVRWSLPWVIITFVTSPLQDCHCDLDVLRNIAPSKPSATLYTMRLWRAGHARVQTP